MERANDLPLILEHFPVVHGADVPNAVGMRLRLLGEDGMPRLVLGYTGDTEYSEDLVNHLIGCDLLLAHISMPDNEEYTDEKHLKKKHLGYNGLAKLIAGVKPKLTLVGEFWAASTDAGHRPDWLGIAPAPARPGSRMHFLRQAHAARPDQDRSRRVTFRPARLSLRALFDLTTV